MDLCPRAAGIEGCEALACGSRNAPNLGSAALPKIATLTRSANALEALF